MFADDLFITKHSDVRNVKGDKTEQEKQTFSSECGVTHGASAF